MLKNRFKNLHLFFLLPLLSALLLLFSFPPFNQGYLAWVGLLPLFFYCQAPATGKKSFLGGLLAGMIFYTYLFSYIAYSVNFVLPPVMGIVVVGIVALHASFFMAIFTFVLSFLLQRVRPFIAALAVPSLWVLLEYIRGFGSFGHSGGYLGFSQAAYHSLFPLVSFYGYWGLPFAMVLFQTVIYYTLLAVQGKYFLAGRRCLLEAPYLPKLRNLILPPVFLILFLVAGFSFPPLFPVSESEEKLRIALIQGNISQEDVLNPEMAADNFTRYISLTKKAVEKYDNLDLIVWPETVYSLNVTRKLPHASAKLAAAAETVHAPILFGAMVEEKAPGNVYNSILLQKPGQAEYATERYDKQKLVPGAEFFPLEGLLNRILKSDVSLGTYTPGRKALPFSLDGFEVGGIICFESYFSGPALGLARRGAEHIFVLTNDAWFLESHGVQQHADAASFRAAELGIGVTQVANTGFTRSYNYRGEKVLDLPPYREGIALLETNLPQRLTLYRLWGDYFVLLCALILGGCFLWIRIRGSR